MDPRFDLDVPPEPDPLARQSEWTVFNDMHSGGGKKLQWAVVYIEASEEVAVRFFRQRFGRDPRNVTCDCCGRDYDICSERESFVQVSAYHRDCYHDSDTDHFEERVRGPESCWKYRTADEYAAGRDAKVIFADEIAPQLN
jgi:hypothetical protein